MFEHLDTDTLEVMARDFRVLVENNHVKLSMGLDVRDCPEECIRLVRENTYYFTMIRQVEKELNKHKNSWWGRIKRFFSENRTNVIIFIFFSTMTAILV